MRSILFGNRGSDRGHLEDSEDRRIDLIDWLNQSEGITLGKSNEYNTTISGMDAVFQFQPASGMTGDLARLIFTNGNLCFGSSLRAEPF
jgi:hypothetical protein